MASELATRQEESALDSKILESLVARGDVSGLSAKERAEYYVHLCGALGLNPASQPIAFIKFQGKEVPYVVRGGTDQLARLWKVNRRIIQAPAIVDIGGQKIAMCVCEASMPDGRVETAIATLPVQDPSNLFMKLETKSKRRATLSILGLGMLDETEIQDMREQFPEKVGASVTTAVAAAESAHVAAEVQTQFQEPTLHDKASDLIEEVLNATTEDQIQAVNAKANQVLPKGDPERKRYGEAMRSQREKLAGVAP